MAECRVQLGVVPRGWSEHPLVLRPHPFSTLKLPPNITLHHPCSAHTRVAESVRRDYISGVSCQHDPGYYVGWVVFNYSNWPRFFFVLIRG